MRRITTQMALFGLLVWLTACSTPPSCDPQPAPTKQFPSQASLVSRISLRQRTSLLEPLVRDIARSPSEVTERDLGRAVVRIQAEAGRRHSVGFEGETVEIPGEDWWLVWCSNVPPESNFYDGLPAGWDYLFEQKLPTFGQLLVVSPTAACRQLDYCNAPGWWGVVIYVKDP